MKVLGLPSQMSGCRCRERSWKFSIAGKVEGEKMDAPEMIWHARIKSKGRCKLGCGTGTEGVLMIFDRQNLLSQSPKKDGMVEGEEAG